MSINSTNAYAPFGMSSVVIPLRSGGAIAPICQRFPHLTCLPIPGMAVAVGVGVRVGLGVGVAVGSGLGVSVGTGVAVSVATGRGVAEGSCWLSRHGLSRFGCNRRNNLGRHRYLDGLDVRRGCCLGNWSPPGCDPQAERLTESTITRMSENCFDMNIPPLMTPICLASKT